MNTLGIYFGPKVISIAETKGKKLINSIQIPQLTFSPGDLEEKVPDEVKIVAIFKDELRRNKIESKEATLCLSGRDLIIRTFEMPSFLPRGELHNAVNFEVRKYIPFKVEDLISDFQVQFDKISRRNIILYMGIKKETIDKYLSIPDQLEIKVNHLEYSGFSILRFLRLSGISDKGIVSIIGVSLEEGDEVNFIVLENGFPLFSHEINLTSGPQEIISGQNLEPAVLLDKLKTEISVSMDYYNRKFPSKRIQRILFISGEDCRLELESFIKDIGLSAQFVDTKHLAKTLGKQVPFSLSFIKGYSSSLSKIIKTSLKTNLLSARAKVSKETGEEAKAVSLIAGLKVDKRAWAVALLICVLAVGFNVYRKIPLEKEISRIISIQPKVPEMKPDITYEELLNMRSNYRKKIRLLDNMMNKPLFLTEPLNLIPGLIPEGVWLDDFTFDKREERADLTLHGLAYLGDSAKELEMINKFLANLKDDPYFNKFKQVSITSVDHSQIADTSVTNFTISCQDYKGEEGR